MEVESTATSWQLVIRAAQGFGGGVRRGQYGHRGRRVMAPMTATVEETRYFERLANEL